MEEEEEEEEVQWREIVGDGGVFCGELMDEDDHVLLIHLLISCYC